MRYERLHIKRNPAQSSLPSAVEAHRGDLRVLSGDGSTTTDTLYFGRNRAGTLEFTQLVPADFPTFNKQIDTSGTAPTVTALAAAGSTAAVSGVAGNGICCFAQLVPGGVGIAAGSVLTITFAVARPDANYTVVVIPHSSAARTLGGVIGPTARSTTAVEISTATALTSGSTYQWAFLIVGY